MTTRNRMILARTILAALALVVAPAQGASAAETGSMPVGDLVIDYDPSMWVVTANAGGASFDRLNDGRTSSAGSIRVAGDGGCDLAAIEARITAAYPDNRSHTVWTVAKAGFDLHLGTVEMGCRNLAGSPVFGCAAFEDKVYTIDADPGGCSHTGHGFDGEVVEFLSGLRAK